MRRSGSGGPECSGSPASTPLAWCLPILLITSFFCRSTGAFILLIAGLTTLWLCTRLGTKLFFYALLLVPPLYYSVRIPDLWSGNELVAFIETYINKDRADSLAFRFEKEALLTDRAMLQPIWGWGGWGRSRVVDERTGRDTTPTDGMWVIYLGSYGLVGLAAWTTFLLLPPWLFVLRVPVRFWRDPRRCAHGGHGGAARYLHGRLPVQRLHESELRPGRRRADRRGFVAGQGPASRAEGRPSRWARVIARHPSGGPRARAAPPGTLSVIAPGTAWPIGTGNFPGSSGPRGSRPKRKPC